MKVVTKGPEAATVQLTSDELRTLSNAINESKEALRDGEFPARIGVDRHEAEILREVISSHSRALRAIGATTETETVPLTRRELVVLQNALKEMRAALEDWEFHIRTGVEPVEAEALCKDISDLLASLKAP